MPSEPGQHHLTSCSGHPRWSVLEVIVIVIALGALGSDLIAWHSALYSWIHNSIHLSLVFDNDQWNVDSVKSFHL